MNITCSVGELRERSLMIGAPLYGGQCHGQFMKSLLEFMVLATKYGLNVKPFFIYNESLITRARNYIADEFMRSDYSRLLFIDSDIGFNAEHIIHMLAIQTDESEYDVLCGPYPKKTIAWEKVKAAVDKGVADEDPGVLENYVGDYVFNPVFNEGVKSIQLKLDEPVEVLESGTGFMMIKRSAFEKFDEKYGDSIKYKPDHVRTQNFDGSREISMYFQAEIVNKRYLSEDYWYCQKLREAGGKIWLCPWVTLSHQGYYSFAGSLQALASIGASATAGKDAVKRKNKGL